MKSGHLAILLTLAIVMALPSACSSPSPAPAPAPPPSAPAPAPPPAPASSTAAAPKATPAAPSPTAAPKATTEINLSAGRAGESYYVLSQALATFINKESTWLRATVAASTGTTAGFQLARDTPNQYIIAASATTAVQTPRDAKTWKNYDGIRWIGGLAPPTQVLVTYDSKIKKLTDLLGKKIVVAAQGAANLADHLAVLDGAGLTNRVTLVHGGYGEAVTNLKDGLADAAFIQIDHTWPFTFAKGTYIMDMESRKPVYYVTLDADVLRKMCAIKPPDVFPVYASGPVTIPAKSLDATTQPDSIIGLTSAIMWAADKSMSNDVVYEFTRILNEHAGQYTTYHALGANMSKQFIPTYLYSKDLMHAGAMKYYNEKGIKVSDLYDLLK